MIYLHAVIINPQTVQLIDVNMDSESIQYESFLFDEQYPVWPQFGQIPSGFPLTETDEHHQIPWSNNQTPVQLIQDHTPPGAPIQRRLHIIQNPDRRVRRRILFENNDIDDAENNRIVRRRIDDLLEPSESDHE